MIQEIYPFILLHLEIWQAKNTFFAIIRQIADPQSFGVNKNSPNLDAFQLSSAGGPTRCWPTMQEFTRTQDRVVILPVAIGMQKRGAFSDSAQGWSRHVRKNGPARFNCSYFSMSKYVATFWWLKQPSRKFMYTLYSQVESFVQRWG